MRKKYKLFYKVMSVETLLWLLYKRGLSRYGFWKIDEIRYRCNQCCSK